jgi:signal transduction histidine kinase
MSFQTKLFLATLTLLLGSVQASVAQDVDPDVEWYESFFKAQKQEKIEVVLEQYHSKLDLARETNDLASEARVLQELGLIHLTETHNYDTAISFLVEALKIEDSLQLNKERIFTYLIIAQVFEEVGDYSKSAQFLEQALEINEEIKNAHVRVLILNELGKVNASDGNLEDARANYTRVLEYKDQLDHPKAQAEALFNLAHLFQLEGNLQEALQQYKLSLSISRSIRDKQREAFTLNNIGELYLVMKNNERGLANHVAALEIRQALKDSKGIAESYNNIGIFYFKQRNYQRAIANLQLALAAAQESQAQHQLGKSYDYMSQCYEALGDYKKALEYKSLFLAINDFIQRDRSEQQLLETQSRYVLDKKESEITKLESDRKQKLKELETQKKLRNTLIAVVTLVVAVAGLVYFLYILKKRSNKLLEEANEKVRQQNLELQDLNATKDKFFSIISHDLKGPLNSLTSFSGLLINHTESLSKEDIQMLAKDLDKSVKNLFALLENLLEWSRSQTGNIEFKPEPFDLASLLEENAQLLKAQAQHKKINLVNESKDKLMVKAHRNSINTVVRNLISNAIKFTPEGGMILVGLKTRPNEVVVSVADDGVGISPQVLEKLFRIDTKHSTKGTADEKGTGLGLILCKDFVEKNGGQMGVESEVGKGSVFYFTLPL